MHIPPITRHTKIAPFSNELYSYYNNYIYHTQLYTLAKRKCGYGQAWPGLTGMSLSRKIYYDLGEWPRLHEEEKKSRSSEEVLKMVAHHSPTGTLRKNVNTEYIYCLCSAVLFFLRYSTDIKQKKEKSITKMANYFRS